MPRARLTDAERLERKRARNARTFSDAAYDHYDRRKEGPGSPADWLRTAETLAGNRGGLKAAMSAEHKADLALLGLDSMPPHIDDLKRAFRKRLYVVHPDRGGTDEKTKDLLAAYGRLCENY